MDVGTFCAQSHVLVVAGKGGVGKTTMTAALARMAADAGKSVLIVELEGKSGITAAFGRREDLGYEEVLLAPAAVGAGGGMTGSVRARRLTPDDALMEYLEDHGLRRVSKRLARSGVLDVVSTAIPGIRDVLVLGKVKQLEREALADLILVDAPATGHAITFLTSASGLVERGPRRAAAHPGPGRRRPAERPGPVPGDPGHPARGAAGLGDDRVGLHPRGQGGRAARAGHRQRLRPRAGRARPPGRARWPRRPAGRTACRPATWPHSRRRAASAWPATPSRASRSSGWAASCRSPASSSRRSTPRRSGRPRPRLLADALAGAVTGLVAEGAR